MVDRDVVLEKTKQIQNCLRRIQEVTNGDPVSLNDIDNQDIFVLNLQRAVQASIDLAAHVIADEGLGLPSELKENFLIMEKNGIITRELSDNLQRMVGFRNIAVHDYKSIDVDVLKRVLVSHLGDLEMFYSAILKRITLV